MKASRILGSTAPSATVLVRAMVGWVFMSEGIQKFLFPRCSGSGKVRQDRHPGSTVLWPVCGRRGACLRGIADRRIADSACFDSTAD